MIRKFPAACFLIFIVSVFTAAADQHYPSFGAYNFPGWFMRHSGFRARLDPYSESALFRADSMFKQVPGLADPTLASFESINFPGRFLRHRNFELWLDPFDGSQLNRADATFRIVQGLADASGISLESYNFPGYYLRHRGFLFFLDPFDGSQLNRADATFYLPYRSFDDSPFRHVDFACGFHLKDFEDGVLDAPGVTITVEPAITGLAVISAATSDGFVDSVDGDDGVIDGLGNGGHSVFNGNAPNEPVPHTLTFTFDPSASGGLPTHAGVVLTDGSGTYTFTAVGASGTQTKSGTVGDFGVRGGTAEDRFFGFVDLGGIESLSIRSARFGFEFDHFQWGAVDVTPPTIAISQSATTLWPPNHNMHLVASVSAADNCDPSPSLTVNVTSNEGSSDDRSVVVNGASYDVYVRAERDGSGSGRIYTITANAMDASGNPSTMSGTVTVPHDMRK